MTKPTLNEARLANAETTKKKTAEPCRKQIPTERKKRAAEPMSGYYPNAINIERERDARQAKEPTSDIGLTDKEQEAVIICYDDCTVKPAKSYGLHPSMLC